MYSGNGTGKLLGTYPTFEACVLAGNAGTKKFTCKATVTPCPAQPAADTRTLSCPAGTIGTWTQTLSYTLQPSPQCWVGQWLPATAPAGTCIAIPPQPADETQSVACQSGTAGTWTQTRSYARIDAAPYWQAGAWMPETAPAGACAAVVMPPVVDHSGMGPTIDKSLIPAPAVGYAWPRVRSVWRDSSTGLDCLPGAVNCQIPSVYVAKADSIGAFRIPCGFARMAFDDPIVFPGQPGASHLHTFTGNVGVDAFSTTASISGAGNSTCDGGTLNRSSYWFPALIDTGNGRPLVPTTNVVYYKDSYDFDISAVVQPLPAGLRMVSGNAKNTDPATTGARYICYGPDGTNPGWKRTITAAFADGTCKVGGDFIMEVGFPYCWDGVNLDSPNHASHLSGVEQYRVSRPAAEGGDYYPKRCPATHPVVLPVISYNVHYAITDDGLIGRARLSSDMDPTLPAGISGHADYFLGWDAPTMNLWLDCLRQKKDCHADVLGVSQTTLH